MDGGRRGLATMNGPATESFPPRSRSDSVDKADHPPSRGHVPERSCVCNRSYLS